MRIQIVVLLLFFVSSFVIVNGVIQLQTVDPGQFKHALTSDDAEDLSFQDADPDIAIDTISRLSG